MSWGAVASAVITGGAAVYSSKKQADAAKSQGQMSYGDYPVSERAEGIQEKLEKLGSQLISGEEIPEFLRPLYQTGTPEFEDFMKMGTRDITKASEEQAALMGIRSARALPALQRNIADYEKTMRYQDFLRGLGGRERLFQTGVGTLSDVRNVELGIDQSKYNAMIDQMMYRDRSESSKGDATAGILGSLGSLAGMIFGGQAPQQEIKSLTPPASVNYPAKTGYNPITPNTSLLQNDYFKYL